MAEYIMESTALVTFGKTLVAVHHRQKPLASHIIAQALEMGSLDLGDGDLSQAENDVARLEVPSERIRFCAVGYMEHAHENPQQLR